MNFKRVAAAAAIAAGVGMSTLTNGIGLVSAAPSDPPPGVPAVQPEPAGPAPGIPAKNAGGTAVPGVETPEAAAASRVSCRRAPATPDQTTVRLADTGSLRHFRRSFVAA